VGTAEVADSTIGHLYISRDAGSTWQQIVNATRVFDISDFGEVIATAVWDEPKNIVSYSLDQGLTWTDCPFYDATQTNATYTVVKVYVELLTDTPQYSTTPLYITYYNAASSYIWVEATDSNSQAAFFIINISRTLPACNSSDYETFLPQGPSKTVQCVLGSQSVFTRKQRTAQCVPDPAVIANVVQNPCPCSRNDYYCTYCFIEAANLSCVLDTTNPDCPKDPAIPAVCPPNTTINALSQYRKVMGSICTGDLPLTQNRTLVVTCPNAPASTTTGSTNPVTSAPASQGGFIALGVIIALLVCGIVGYVIWRIVNKKCACMGAKFDDHVDSDL